MNELELLKKLGSAAQREEVPDVDVSHRVLSALAAAEDDLSPSLAWIAGVSFAARWGTVRAGGRAANERMGASWWLTSS